MDMFNATRLVSDSRWTEPKECPVSLQGFLVLGSSGAHPALTVSDKRSCGLVVNNQAGSSTLRGYTSLIRSLVRTNITTVLLKLARPWSPFSLAVWPLS
jgi:hypothetical protein